MNAILRYRNPSNKSTAKTIARKFNINYNYFLRRLRAYRYDEIVRRAYKLQKCFVELNRIDQEVTPGNQDEGENEEFQIIPYENGQDIDDDQITLIEVEVISDSENDVTQENEEDPLHLDEVSTEIEFSNGEIVFAKQNGSIPLPAEVRSKRSNQFILFIFFSFLLQILSKSKRGYFLAFFGSGNYANINALNIWSYDDYQHDFITAISMKDKNFKEAIECLQEHFLNQNSIENEESSN